MIKRAEEMGAKHYEKMHNGNGAVDASKFLEAEESYGCGSFFGRAKIAPGGSIGYHHHNGEYEIYYILSGTAKVSDNGREFLLGPGDMMQCRDGEGHSIENCGETDLEFLAMVLLNHEK